MRAPVSRWVGAPGWARRVGARLPGGRCWLLTVVSADSYNLSDSNTVVGVAISSNVDLAESPGNVELAGAGSGLRPRLRRERDPGGDHRQGAPRRPARLNARRASATGAPQRPGQRGRCWDRAACGGRPEARAGTGSLSAAPHSRHQPPPRAAACSPSSYGPGGRATDERRSWATTPPATPPRPSFTGEDPLNAESRHCSVVVHVVADDSPSRRRLSPAGTRRKQPRRRRGTARSHMRARSKSTHRRCPQTPPASTPSPWPPPTPASSVERSPAEALDEESTPRRRPATATCRGPCASAGAVRRDALSSSSRR